MQENFEWLLLDISDRKAAAIPVLKRTGGVLIALPGSCFSEEELAAGSVGEEIQDLGPHLKTNILVHNSLEDAVVSVLVLDFPSLMFTHLKVMPRALNWPDGTIRFGPEGGEQLPDLDELVQEVQQWVETGEVRASEHYHSAIEDVDIAPNPPPTGGAAQASPQVLDAVLTQLENLATSVNRLQSQVDAGTRGAGTVPSPQPNALQQISRLAGPKPKAKPGLADVEPQQAHPGIAVEDEVAIDEAGVDQLLKVALVKLLKPKSKGKTSLGLNMDCASSDEDAEDGDPLRRLQGAKGTLLQERLRTSMDKQPQLYVQAIEERACRVLGESQPSALTMERYVREEVPVGTDRTLGHTLWGITKMCSLLRAGQAEKAHLVGLLLIASVEQMKMDSNWGAAWNLTHLATPPWAEWRVRDSNLQSLRQDHSHSRLIHPTWIAAVVAKLRDDEVLLKKRGKVHTTSESGALGSQDMHPKGRGRGRGRHNPGPQQQQQETDA